MVSTTLQLHTPLSQGAPLVPQSFRVESARVTTSIEHGMESCELTFPSMQQNVLRPAWFSEPSAEYREMGHVTLVTGTGDILFSGRASGPPQIVGGVIRGVTAQGYWDAFNDRTYVTSNAGTVTSGTIIADVITQVTSYIAIDMETWTDPQVQHTYNEFTETLGGQVIDSLLREGSSGATFDLRIWPRPDGRLIAELRDRVAPAVADLECDWIADPRVMNLTYDPHQMYSHVRGHYTPSGGTATYTDWQPSLEDHSFFDRWGFERQTTLELGEKTAEGAQQFRDTQQAMLSKRQWGGSVNISSQYPLFDAGSNVAVPVWTIRAGKWLHVRGLDDGLLLIQRCTYDLATDTAALTVGMGITQRTVQQRATETVNAVRAHRNPISGARAI